jgi:hypothetical protein
MMIGDWRLIDDWGIARSSHSIAQLNGALPQSPNHPMNRQSSIINRQ